MSKTAITRVLAGLSTAALLSGCASTMESIAQAKPRYPTRIEDLPAMQPQQPAPPATQAAPAPSRAAAQPAGDGVIRAEPIPAAHQTVTEDAPPPPPPPPPPATVIPASTAAQVSTAAQARADDGPRSSRESTYVVQPGDTLTGIRRRFAVGTLGELIDLNDLPPEGTLRAGQRLRLPAGVVDRGEETFAKGTTPQGVPRADGAPAPTRTAEAPAQRPAATPQPSAPAPSTPSTPAPAASTPAPATPAPTPATPPARPPAATAPALPSSGGFPSAEELRRMAQGRFAWPLRGEILSRFGALGPGLHNDGVNIGATAGSAVRAAAEGEVVYAGDQVPGFGNLVLIRHADGWVTAYGHLGKIDVRMRQTVTRGQAIGTVGQTGGVDRPQLHFEIRYAPSPADRARPVDPLPLLP